MHAALTQSFGEASVSALVERHLTAGQDRPTRVSEIAVAVCLEIVRGRLAGGVEINSVRLAERFSSSRTPVREALMVLAQEGLVELPPRRRPIVSEPNAQDIRENYRLRMILMPAVMDEVARTASHEELQELEQRFDAMRAAASRTADEYFWANVEFHEFAVSAAHNALLKSVIDRLFLRALRFRYLGMTLPGRVQRSCEDHALLMRALRERDAELAAAIIKSNINGAWRAIEARG
jgi:DNA-binding GntR family transcriptional regulator